MTQAAFLETLYKKPQSPTERTLKIALAREKRAWLDGLFDIAKTAHPPFQFANE
jgi:hypothetical protein